MNYIQVINNIVNITYIRFKYCDKSILIVPLVGACVNGYLLDDTNVI